MGSYAMDYINQIIAIMSQAEQNNSCFELRGIEELEQKIKLIILYRRKKIMRLFNNHSYTNRLPMKGSK